MFQQTLHSQQPGQRLILQSESTQVQQVVTCQLEMI